MGWVGGWVGKSLCRRTARQCRRRCTAGRRAGSRGGGGPSTPPGPKRSGPSPTPPAASRRRPPHLPPTHPLPSPCGQMPAHGGLGPPGLRRVLARRRGQWGRWTWRRKGRHPKKRGWRTGAQPHRPPTRWCRASRRFRTRPWSGGGGRWAQGCPHWCWWGAWRKSPTCV